MNDETNIYDTYFDRFSPDKFEDIKEVIDQIYPLFYEYDLTLTDEIEIMFSVLERKIKTRLEKGHIGGNICHQLMNAHLDITENIMDFEESLNE